jgi:hypothetical protein
MQKNITSCMTIGEVVIQSLKQGFEDDIPRLGAALAFYALLSLVPVKSCFCWKSGGGKRVLGWLKFAWQNQRLVEGEALRAA